MKATEAPVRGQRRINLLIRMETVFMEARRRVAGLVAMVLLLPGYGCQEENEYRPPPPPEVAVQTPQKRDVTEYVDFTGRTQEVASAEIRARVRGFLTVVHFE